jgi:hypothetical protein
MSYKLFDIDGRLLLADLVTLGKDDGKWQLPLTQLIDKLYIHSLRRNP